MPESVKKHRPASWTWTEYQDGEMITVTDGEQSAQTTRRTLAEAAEDAYDTLKGYFFAAPPEIPVEEYKATLKFLKFLKTLTNEDVWETSGEVQIDASVYVMEK